MRLALALLVVVGAVSFVACGDSQGGGPASGTRGPAADASPEAAVKGRLLALFAAAPAGGAHVAPFVAYKGKDDARRYKEAATYAGDDVRQIDRVADRIRKHLAAGTPTFEKAETRAKGGESWVAWTITFGSGATAVKALYACVKAGDVWLLGDIDG